MMYEELLKKQQQIKEKLLLSKIPEDELILFGGIKLHEKMDLSLLSNDKLLLAHSCTHTMYSKKNRFVDLDRVFAIHQRIVSEMCKRGLEHLYFDKLDDK